ncbi:hypothetical protein DPMN_006669 [Dreissena polymorpha]|uniref:Uncharacterized protein n=1 Tax=Dreissena polymorpha TaxID=45954 RepID=A0A9D4MSU2_DREPO|nr:hypothetical protein DPMN_006669 [Dreissena polymorpha]
MRNCNKSVTEGSKEGRKDKLATICSPKVFREHKNVSNEMQSHGWRDQLKACANASLNAREFSAQKQCTDY